MNGRMTKKTAFRFSLALFASGALAASLGSCTTPRHVEQSAVEPAKAALTRINYPADRKLQCVPFARDASGVQIYGDAWTWWDKAEARYGRGSTPRPGAVLTLKKADRLSSGHVAVVSAIIDSRRILVDHANWGDRAETRGRIHLDQPVIDVSPNNDWSALRFLNAQGTFGAVYPAHGFIYPDTEIRTAQK